MTWTARQERIGHIEPGLRQAHELPAPVRIPTVGPKGPAGDSGVHGKKREIRISW